MKKIIIDINNYSRDFITAVEDDNNSDVYKIILTENNEVIDLTDKTVKMAYVLDYTTEKDVIDLNITNPTEAEITLVISEVLTRKEGNYSCQLLILGANDYRRHSNFFKLYIKENLFSLMAGDIISKPTFSLLQDLIKKAETLNTELSTNINSGNEVNSNLSENITIAEPLNNNLNENIIEAKKVKSELETSTSEANNQNEHLKESISEADTINSSLESNINSAKEITTNLDINLDQANIKIAEVNQKKEELENTINEADTINSKLIENSKNADDLNNNLESNISLAESIKETIKDLDSKNIEATEKIEELTDLNSEATGLANVIIEGLPLNSELVRNIEEAKVNNTNLSATNQTATRKKSELETSLAKTERFIAGLNGSQNIPQIRLDLDKLQKGLKSNQSLAYKGSSISADNTLGSRTEGMIIRGKTYKNEMPPLDPENFKFDGKTNLEGDIFTTYHSKSFYDSMIKCKLGKTNLKPNTTYSVIVDILENDTNTYLDMFTASNFFYPNSKFENKIGKTIAVGTTPAKRESWGDEFTFCIYGSGDGSKKIKFKAMILEGDWRNRAVLPDYFKDLSSFGEAEQVGNKFKVSTKSTSKNLFNIDYSKKVSDCAVFNDDGTITFNQSDRGLIIRDKGFKHWSIGDWYTLSFVGISGECSLEFVYDDDTTTTVKGIGNVRGTADRNKTIKLIRSKSIDGSKSVIKNVQLEKGRDVTSYAQYNEDRKDILISEPLRSVEDIEDVMYEESGQVKITRNIIKYLITGDETIRDTTEQDEKSGTGNYKVFNIGIDEKININKNINNNFPKKNFSVAFQNMESEGLAVTQYGIYIKILKTKLETQDIEGMKTWLKANDTIIYYPSSEPLIETVKYVDLDLDTFQDKTYFEVENTLPGTLEFKVPSNLGTMIEVISKEINSIWDVINMIVAGLLDTKKDLARKTIKNNLK